jgi:WD40 repeat protein
VLLALAAFGPEPLLPGAPHVLRGHSQAITALAFSPDGTTLATAARDGQVKVWRLATGELTRAIGGAEEQVNALAFSPDGQRLAIGETALKFRVVRLVDGAVMSEVAHPDAVSSLAFAPDASVIAVGGQQNSGALYTLANGVVRFTFRGRSAQFSKDGRTLVIANGAGSLSLLDARTGHERARVSSAPHLPQASLSADGTTLVSWNGTEPDVHLWSPVTLKAQGVLLGPGEGAARPRVLGLSLSADGKAGATCSSDGVVRVWNLASRSVERAWPAEQASVVALCAGWVAVGAGPLVLLWKRDATG